MELPAVSAEHAPGNLLHALSEILISIISWMTAGLLSEKVLGNPACCDASLRLQAETFLGWWLDAGNGVARSPAFASWLGPTSALRNQANAALLAWVYGRGSGGGPGKLFCWAEFQVFSRSPCRTTETCALPCPALNSQIRALYHLAGTGSCCADYITGASSSAFFK